LAAALSSVSAGIAAAPAAAQGLERLRFDGPGSELQDVVWIAITAGTALAALLASGLLVRFRRDDRLAAAERQVMTLRAALDRTEALLDADDQRTVVWDTGGAPAQVFGGLPERVGAPGDPARFVQFDTWLNGESVAELDSATEKLRRAGQSFQIPVRATTGSLIEVTGRTSGRRSVMRFRELTGERRSFAELKEQAVYVVNEMTALRALADLLPFPLWRRNRLGRLTWVNHAYVQAVEAASAEAVLSGGIELLPTRARDAIREAERGGGAFRDSATAIVAGERRRLEVIDMPIDEGRSAAPSTSRRSTLSAAS
jgi:PAS domain-containing protein